MLNFGRIFSSGWEAGLECLKKTRLTQFFCTFGIYRDEFTAIQRDQVISLSLKSHQDNTGIIKPAVIHIIPAVVLPKEGITAFTYLPLPMEVFHIAHCWLSFNAILEKSCEKEILQLLTKNF